MNQLHNEELVQLLQKLHYHISCAESCTGGLLASSIVEVPAASSVFDMSFVTYANEAKTELVSVSPTTIEAYGVVSEEVAKEMAVGCATKAHAEVGVGISGIAGPTGATPKKPVGTVCDVNIDKLVKFHKSHGKIATLTAVVLEQEKGVLDIDDTYTVRAFREKQQRDGATINAGYMVLEPKIFDYIRGDDSVFERTPLTRLAEEGQLMSYMHKGYWQCMDTAMEKEKLEKYWQTNKAPWKKWDD